MKMFRPLPSCLAIASLAVAPVYSQIIAYQIEAGTVGNQDFGGALGMDFIVNKSIIVEDLGVFDSGSDGLTRAITVELWSRLDGGTPGVFNDDAGDSILAFADFGVGQEGTLVGGSRFKPLAAPLELSAGAYTIVAHGYGPGEPNFNQIAAADPRLTTATTDAITFVGGSRWGDPAANGQFPLNLDGEPVNRYGSGTFSFTPKDIDGDGMPNAWEIEHGLDPNDNGHIDPVNGADGDPDSDTLSNFGEFQRGTDPRKPDTDDDGLGDAVEDNTGTYVSPSQTGTNPLLADTDGDGIDDGDEVAYAYNPLNPDSNGDGTPDGQDDADEDGLTAAEEIAAGSSPLTDDTDGDGLKDGDEVHIHGTNPAKADSDGDLLTDPVEITATKTNPLLADSDGNGTDDAEEDLDKDGFTNLQEVVLLLTDPLDGSSRFAPVFSHSPTAHSVTFPALSDRSYRVERSINMDDWAEVITFVGSGSTVSVPLGPPFSKRWFYRVVVSLD